MLELDNDEDAEYFIPLIWQGDGAWPSPGYSTRGSMYGVSGIPHSQWNGYEDIVGGGGSMYNSYLNMYNGLVDDESPLELQTGLGFDTNGDLLVQAAVEVTQDITTTNNKIVYIVKWRQDNDYFSTVVNYDYEDFELTSVGETGLYSHSFPMNDSWEIEDLHAVAMVQTYSGNHQILQAGQAQLTGLVAGIGSNLTTGPPTLGVHFQNLSYPLSGIESWEWDVDGDGDYDYTEENPFHLYDNPGTYDVSLRIGMEGEFDEITIEDYITVTDDGPVQGNVCGIWHEDHTYEITGDVLVKAGNALDIEPGTHITVNGGAQFEVKGLLTADGSSDSYITFSSDDEWAGLYLVDTMEENIIKFCDISGSVSSAVYLDNSNCTVSNNLIHHNTASGLGAAIEMEAVADILIERNYIYNNTSSGLTGGISMTSSYPLIYNNIIVNNTAGTAGAFSIKQDSAPVIANCTIANNVGVNGAFLLFNSTPSITNSIIISDNSVFAVIASTPTVMYSCLSGGYDGEGNMDADPLFINPSEGSGSDYDGFTNWKLEDESPCIDAGNPNPVYNDLDGSQNDMGAYGWNGFPEYEYTDENPDQIVPAELGLKVFPNPFNPVSFISFELDRAQSVSVDIYNLRGEKIKEFPVRRYSQGQHELVWNAEKVASGVYFIKLNKDSGSVLQKAVLMK